MQHDPRPMDDEHNPMPAPGKDVYALTPEECEAKVRWYERRGHHGSADIIRNPHGEQQS